MSTHERPGVYTSWQISGGLRGSGSGRVVGLAATAGSGTAGTLSRITSLSAAKAAFGADCAMTKLIAILFKNGASAVAAVPVSIGGTPDTAAYTAAFAVLCGEASVGYMVCDSRSAAVHSALKSVIEAETRETHKYRVAVAEQTGTVQELTAAAAALNYERMALLRVPDPDEEPGACACALCGLMASGGDPSLPLGGAALMGLDCGELCYTDAEITSLVTGGVCPVEVIGSEPVVVRAVTTRTTTAGAADATWRELSTILTVDDVVPYVRDALRSRFSRCRNTAQTRGAIRSQVTAALELKLSAGLIADYDSVTVEANAADPAVCDVGFAFSVAAGLAVIDLIAYITV